MFSLLIRNGIVIDSENGKQEKMDLAVDADRIVRMEPEISGEAVSEIDASGCFVTPGLIDHHTHIYPMAKIGIPGEAVCFASGVTTAVDAGSTGCDTYEKYRSFIQAQKLEIRCYLNVCSTGLDSLPAEMEDVSAEHMNENAIRELLERYPGELLGLKLRTSRKIVGERGYEPLKAAVALGERLGLPLMVHITDPPGTVEELLEILRPGDIVTHMYQNIGDTILKDKAVSEAAWKARERGVLFEAADARAHFSFEVSEPAVAEGFFPDMLGTDITKFSRHLRPTSFNMAMQISKYVHLGIAFPEIIRRASWNSAVNMGISDRVGSLRVGKQADIAIFRAIQAKNLFGDRPYSDSTGALREGNLVFVPMMTVKKGEMVYRNLLF